MKRQYIDAYKGFIHILYIHYTLIFVNKYNEKNLTLIKTRKTLKFHA